MNRNSNYRYNKHHSEPKSYSQRKRDKLDYRHEYFSHNPGLFGSIYFCAYCKKPLFRNEVEVDHIMPLNNPLGRNVRFNLVASCRDCNRAKSDTVDGRVVIGYLSKCTDTAVFSMHKVFVHSFHLLGNLIHMFIKLTVSLLHFLFRNASPKLILVVIFIVLLIIIGAIK